MGGNPPQCFSPVSWPRSPLSGAATTKALFPLHVFLPLSDNDSLISSSGYTHHAPLPIAKVEKMQYSAAIWLPWDRATALLQPFLQCQPSLVFFLQGFEKIISVAASLCIWQGKARKEALLIGVPLIMSLYLEEMAWLTLLQGPYTAVPLGIGW